MHGAIGSKGSKGKPLHTPLYIPCICASHGTQAAHHHYRKAYMLKCWARTPSQHGCERSPTIIHDRLPSWPAKLAPAQSGVTGGTAAATPWVSGGPPTLLQLGVLVFARASYRPGWAQTVSRALRAAPLRPWCRCALGHLDRARLPALRRKGPCGCWQCQRKRAAARRMKRPCLCERGDSRARSASAGLFHT